ncbi:hypothetical protein GCM10011507_34900 [Edaphobacter acidisoli]|uniref:DUF3168 domain-containing protein n=1 Tax=Edaphobacter acidisoli TaxID=2040573 RepID=A0A916S2E8_9BACT|nr:hypothetical protein [Edaphobacter acidisoli]GGA80703.1 hypothetical protein GCM10011507_34900 [Edaphobacter acidisoli]
MILEGIVALIVQAGSGLEAITANRIFPITLPENIGATLATGPAITFQIVGGRSDPTFETSGLQMLRVQFDCYAVGTASASGAKTAYQVRDALTQLLNGYRGALPDGSWLEGAELIQMIDFFESAARQYRCMVEFYLYFNFNFA